MVKRTSKTQRLIEVVRRHGHPISLKIRLGANTYQKSVKVYLNCLRETAADLYVVEAKTAAQESREEYDYSVFPECVDAAAGKQVIANGGIDSPETVKELQETGVSGVMIGRAALGNPAIFDQIKTRLGLPSKPVPVIEDLRAEYTELHKLYAGDEAHINNLQRTMGRPVASAHY